MNEQTIIVSDVDYLTLTQVPKNEHFHDFNKKALAFFEFAEGHGAKVEEKSRSGYDGFAIQGSFYGIRGDSAKWESSGDVAREAAWWAKVKGIEAKSTRIDFQTTVRYGDAAVSQFERMREAVLDAEREVADGGKATKGRFEAAGRDTGITLGHRSSKRYLRAYLAGIRHRGKYPDDSVRFEVELKQELAQQGFNMLKSCEEIAPLAASLVIGEFMRKGIVEKWYSNTLPQNMEPVSYTQNDDKTLYWLENSVSKTIQKLIKNGHREKVENILRSALEASPEVVRHCNTLERRK